MFQSPCRDDRRSHVEVKTPCLYFVGFNPLVGMIVVHT